MPVACAVVVRLRMDRKQTEFILDSGDETPPDGTFYFTLLLGITSRVFQGTYTPIGRRVDKVLN